MNGWALLAEKIRGLGLKPLQEKKPMRNTTTEPTKEEGKENKHPSKNKVLSGVHPDVKAVDEGGSSVENAVWVDASDCLWEGARDLAVLFDREVEDKTGAYSYGKGGGGLGQRSLEVKQGCDASHLK